MSDQSARTGHRSGHSVGEPAPPARAASLHDWKSAVRSAPHYPPVRRRNLSGPLPLSFGQRRLWFLSQLPLGSVAYNVPMGWRFHGPLSAEALRRSVSALVRRHHALRTSYFLQDGEPVQVVNPSSTDVLTVVDLRDCGDGESEFSELLAEELRKPFSLSHEPALRAVLFHLRGDEHVLILTVHHIACDGQSVGLLLRELSQLYAACSSGGDFPVLPDLPQCSDITAWQADFFTPELRDTQLAYWAETLSGAPLSLDLPSDAVGADALSFRGGIERLQLSSAVTDAFRQMTRRHGITTFMGLLSALQVLLFRFTGQPDVIVGASMTNRTRDEIAQSIGYISNLLPMRADLSDDPTFAEMLRRTRSTVLGAYAHCDVPFEDIVTKLQPDRSAGRTPLIQVILNLEDTAWHELPLAGLTSTEIPLHQGTARFDLNLSVVDGPSGFRLGLEYNSDLFSAASAGCMLKAYATLLEEASANFRERVSRLSLLQEPERRDLLHLNAGSSPVRASAIIPQLIEAQVQRTPNSVAVRCNERKLSYAELSALSNQFARYLVKQGAGRGALVAICLDRNIHLLVAVLGIWKAGAVYVPLDPAHPAQRRVDILLECGARFLITQERLMGEMADAESVAMLPIEMVVPMLALHSAADLPPAAEPDDLAYVMYTSGSTGRPKGVQIQHRNAVNFVQAMPSCPGMCEQDVVLAITTVTFDPSILELIVPLTVGAQVVIASREQAADSHQLATLIEQSSATVLQATPTTWKMLLATGWQGSKRLKALCGGEVLSRGLADQLLSRCGSLWNIYGPTETTVWSFVHQVSREDERTPPIGRPIPNVRDYVLDTNLQPVPVGVTGELYIGGAGVGPGYVAAPAVNEERFIANPFSGDAEDRLYRTGDLVRRRHDGALDFVARSDRQIKLRGNRVEPGEVESALLRHPNVQQAAVLPRVDLSGANTLVAYVVPRRAPLIVDHDDRIPEEPSRELTLVSTPPAPLREFLATQLPDYMVPSAYVQLASLPQTLTAKLDISALPSPCFTAALARRVTPRDALERRLANVWENILGVSGLGVNDDFFHCGGHSVLGAVLFARIEKEFGKRLPLTALFEAPTIEKMAALLRRGESETACVFPIQAGNPAIAPLFFVHAAEGYVHLAKALGPEYPVYVVQYQNLFDHSTERTFQEICDELCARIRQVQPVGPYLLGGACLAGLVAFEIARSLERQGEQTSLVAIIDSFSPGRLVEPAQPGRWRKKAAHLRWHASNLVCLEAKQQRAYLHDRARTLRWHMINKLWWKMYGIHRALNRPLPQRFRHPARLIAQAAMTAPPGRPYHGPIALFRPRMRPATEEDPYRGWNEIASNVTLHEVAGDHKHLMFPPNVADLAGHLRHHLSALRTPAPATESANHTAEAVSA